MKKRKNKKLNIKVEVALFQVKKDFYFFYKKLIDSI